VLVDWNGLAIAALVIAGRQFARPEWVEAADTAFRFVCESMSDRRLPHSIRGEKRLFPALSSDYAAMISAAVALHGALQQESYIEQALRWLEDLDASYLDESGGGYYLTAFDSPDTPMRIRGDVDDAVLSATAQTIAAMTQLATVSGNSRLYEQATRAAESALARARSQAYGQSGIVWAAALAQRPLKLLVNDPTREKFVPVANRIPDPRRVDILVGEQESAAERQIGFRIDRSLTAAWLCVGQACLPPIEEAGVLEAALKSARKGSGDW